jgi:hypothetical protein
MTASLNNSRTSDIGLRSATADSHPEEGRRGVPCVYCRSVIPAAKFAFWSDAKRLLSADCPACERRVTLATSTWRRWLRSLST